MGSASILAKNTKDQLSTLGRDSDIESIKRNPQRFPNPQPASSERMPTQFFSLKRKFLVVRDRLTNFYPLTGK